ncbi:MAG: prolipoprotein diacylglyceryl transferase, partial [Bifidobacterium breve]|nr:prolipoprotein diacylglyceryl transferase [Bifidobacterium breve]
MWYGLGRTWIENVRINYSTVILGLRTNVWTAIIVFVIGCILFIVLYQHGPDSKVQARQLAAVTADELERQSIEEERLRQKKSQRGNMQ